eukprot:2528059-Alexandrium_andersonii.AAC.1
MSASLVGSEMCIRDRVMNKRLHCEHNCGLFGIGATQIQTCELRCPNCAWQQHPNVTSTSAFCHRPCYGVSQCKGAGAGRQRATGGATAAREGRNRRECELWD